MKEIYYFIEYTNKENTFVSDLRIFNSPNNNSNLLTIKPTEELNRAIKYPNKELAESVLNIVGKDNFKITVKEINND